MSRQEKSLRRMREVWENGVGDRGGKRNDKLCLSLQIMFFVATYSSIFAWEIPWTEEPRSLQSMGSQSRTRLSEQHMHTHTHTHISITISSPIKKIYLFYVCSFLHDTLLCTTFTAESYHRIFHVSITCPCLFLVL